MTSIPQSVLDSVVTIGVQHPDGEKNWVGTGFLVGRLYQHVPDGWSDYHLFLVTNRHVLEDLERIIVRFNPHPHLDQSARDYPVELSDPWGNTRWTGHPRDDVDVAVINLRYPKVLNDHGMRFSFFHFDTDLLTIDEMARIGVSEGDSVYVLGYPMNLVGPDKHYVVVRSGSVARVRDMFQRQGDHFLVDVPTFPGNSGGPVILKKPFAKDQDRSRRGRACLIGVVDNCIRFRHRRINKETGTEDLVFDENSGLSRVVPTNFIRETVEECFGKRIGISDETSDPKDEEDLSYWPRITERIKAFWRHQDQVLCRRIFWERENTCQLCGKHPITERYLLENLTSKESMWVGRKCVFNCIIAMRQLGVKAVMLFPSRHTIYANRFNERWPGSARIIMDFDNDRDP